MLEKTAVGNVLGGRESLPPIAAFCPTSSVARLGCVTDVSKMK